jgi:DNA polymerase III alpha subunit (gram-positive type)
MAFNCGRHEPAAIMVGHNFIAYDAPMLNRFWKARIPIQKIVDTFVLSQVYNPNYPKPKGLNGTEERSSSLRGLGYDG